MTTKNEKPSLAPGESSPVFSLMLRLGRYVYFTAFASHLFRDEMTRNGKYKWPCQRCIFCKRTIQDLVSENVRSDHR